MLEAEDPAALRAQHERLTAWFAPADPLEEFLIERVVVAQLRMCRAASMEAALVQYRLEQEAVLLTGHTSEMSRRCYAYMRDCANGNSTAQLGQHETRLRREYDGCCKEVRAILAARTREAAAPATDEPLVEAPISVARIPAKRAGRTGTKSPATGHRLPVTGR
jgi:hypothetical protein